MPESENPDPPTIVLVRPQLGENIGAAARGMLNFGVHGLRIVEPRDGWPNQAAIAMASGAGRILEQAQIFSDVPSAVADMNIVLATTARRRDLCKPVLMPDQAMAEVRSHCFNGQRVAIMFGPERTGLENSELVIASAIIEVPVNPTFRSINLAQCVLLICYEWMQCANAEVAVDRSVSAPANLEEKKRFVDLLIHDLEQAGHFWPPNKANGMILNIRNLIMRLELSGAELKSLHGVRRTLTRYAPDGVTHTNSQNQNDD